MTADFVKGSEAGQDRGSIPWLPQGLPSLQSVRICRLDELRGCSTVQPGLGRPARAFPSRAEFVKSPEACTQVQSDIGSCVSLEVGDIGKDQEQSRRAGDADTLDVHATQCISPFVDLKELCDRVSGFDTHHAGVRRAWALWGSRLSVSSRHPGSVGVDDILVILHVK